jgi:porin
MSSDTAALFVNSAFGADFFTGNMPNGGPAYPMSLPGLRLAWQPTSWLTLRSALTQANPFAQNVNRTGLNWDFSSSGGLLSMNEIAASWNKDPQSKGLSGTVKAGFWMQNSQAVIAQGISTSASTSGFYGILDQQLYVVPNKVLPFLTSAPEGKNPPSPPDASCTCPSKGLSSFARIEFSPQQGSPVGLYSDAGLVYTGLLPTRDADKLGVALGYAQMGSQVASLTRATGAPGVGYEAVAELSYAMQMTPAISIQPDLQLILHPGGTQQYGNALVLGVRAVVNF